MCSHVVCVCVSTGVLFCCLSPSGRHLRCLQLLLSSDADVNNVSAAGKPVLLAACEVAQQEVGVALSLLEGGADPNIGHQVLELLNDSGLF